MPNHLSVLGIVHTAFSIVAIIAAVIALAKQGVIDPKSTFGRYYIVLTIVCCVSGFPIMRTGHFGPAHALTIMVLALLPLGIYAKAMSLFGKKAAYVEVIVMSATLFLSLVPAVNESLTRLPMSHPLAASPDDPLVKMGLLILFTLFIIGVIYQALILRAQRRLLVTLA